MNSCFVCRAAASHRCARCHLIGYCGQACQQSHWPTHKARCDEVNAASKLVSTMAEDGPKVQAARESCGGAVAEKMKRDKIEIGLMVAGMKARSFGARPDPHFAASCKPKANNKRVARAEKGCVNSLAQLGYITELGLCKLVPADAAKAASLYVRALEGGSAVHPLGLGGGGDAGMTVSRLLNLAEVPNSGCNIGMAAALCVASKWASSPTAPKSLFFSGACTVLAQFYYKLGGADANKEAYAWMERAAASGGEYAQYFIAAAAAPCCCDDCVAEKATRERAARKC